MKSLAAVNIGLSTLVLIGLAMSHLALTDIAHGVEPDLTAEWWVIRVTFVLVGALVISALYTAQAIIRSRM